MEFFYVFTLPFFANVNTGECVKKNSENSEFYLNEFF